MDDPARSSGMPVPWQEGAETMRGVPGDATEDVHEPDVRVDAVQLGGDDEAVHDRRALPAAIGAGEQP